MKAEIINNQNRALEALREYKKSILEEFLSLAESLSKEMEVLCDTGIDTDLHLCFENVEVDENETEEILYTVVNREEVIRFKKILESMNEENAMNLFEENVSQDTIVNIWGYEEFVTMQELATANKDIQVAIVFIEQVEWQK